MNIRPSWATGSAITAIIFAVFGLFSASQMFIAPVVFEMQQKMMSSISEVSDIATEELEPSKPLEEMTEEEREAYEDLKAETEMVGEVTDEMTDMMTNMFKVPSWFKTFCYVAGAVGILVSGLMIVASSFLLMMRKGSPKFFTIACWVMVGYALIKAGIAASGGTMMMLSYLSGPLFGIIAFTTIAIIVHMADKTAYEQAAEFRGDHV